MSREELMRIIQALSFAKCEAELFLDTHPECREALDYFHNTVKELDTAMAEYQKSYGPLVSEAASTDRWNWIEGPWPWQCEDIKMGLNCRGERK